MRLSIKKKIHMILIALVAFLIASIVSIYSYGIFASRVRGDSGYALPVQPNQTALDRATQSYTDKHPDQTGLILLRDNLDAFIARAISAREAGRSLDLQYYIWHDDLTGKLLDLEILRAADRGVRVRMILDDMTAHGRESALAALNAHPNIEIRLFNPTRARQNQLLRGIEMLLRLVNTNRRMHNKAWIADNRVAIVGGRNIGNEYFDAASNMNFFDLDMLLCGPAVTETSAIFDNFWNSAAVIPLSALHTTPDNALEELRIEIQNHLDDLNAQPYVQRLEQTPSTEMFYSGELPIYWSQQVHVYSDPAEKGLGQAHQQWLINRLYNLWEGTQEDFKIISPYFVPGKQGVEGFSRLVEHGVNVSILTNSLAATDVVASHSGYAPYRMPLLESGIHLYELKPFSTQKIQLFGSSGASLHTKAFLIDHRLGFVGSFNFDPRSANLNTEMGVIFTEPQIITQLNEEFEERTSSRYSYEISLHPDTNQLLWLDASGVQTKTNKGKNPPHLWSTEPQTTWYKRAIAKVLEWLPIEPFL